MIPTFLSWVGKLFAGPVVDLAGDYFKAQTDHHKIDADVEMAEIEAGHDEALADIDFHTQETLAGYAYGTEALHHGTQAMEWLKVGIGAIFALHILGVVIASMIPALGWTVNALPGLLSLVELLYLIVIAGPDALRVWREIKGA